MACFIAPTAEAIVMTIVKRNLEKKEAQRVALNPESEVSDKNGETGIPWSRKLGWLTNLLWGGSFLLAIEHIWHGEVVPWPPFLTAMNNPADIAPMLQEIATVGVSMAILVTVIWGIIVLVADNLHKRTSVAMHAAQEE